MGGDMGQRQGSDTMAMTSTELYEQIGQMLGTGHETLIRGPYFRRTRWNNREAGNGRYPGHGLVRYYAEDHIVITFRSGDISGRYHTPEQALAAIARYVASGAPGHP